VVERFSRRRLGHDASAVRPIRAQELVLLPVRLHGIQLGRPVDVLLDRDDRRVLGLDILCRDGVHRFLPLPVASIRDEELAISSPLVLLEEDELDFYRARSFGLASLRGRAVEQGGRPRGTLRDVVVGPGGALAELIVETEGGTKRLPFDPTVRFQPESRSAA
jgi:hypothetical protein